MKKYNLLWFRFEQCKAITQWIKLVLYPNLIKFVFANCTMHAATVPTIWCIVTIVLIPWWFFIFLWKFLKLVHHSCWALGQVLVSFVWFLIHYPLSFEWGKSSKVPLNMHNLQSTFMIMFSYYTILPYFCEFEMGSIMHDSCVSQS